MDWQAEAQALIDDISNYVNKIEISKSHKSSNYRLYFDVETLERTKLLVSMDSSGFMICDKDTGGSATSTDNQEQDSEHVKIYETINSLLDHNSPKYREAFAGDLQRKIKSLG